MLESAAKRTPPPTVSEKRQCIGRNVSVHFREGTEFHGQVISWTHSHLTMQYDDNLKLTIPTDGLTAWEITD